MLKRGNCTGRASEWMAKGSSRRPIQGFPCPPPPTSWRPAQSLNTVHRPGNPPAPCHPLLATRSLPPAPCQTLETRPIPGIHPPTARIPVPAPRLHSSPPTRERPPLFSQGDSHNLEAGAARDSCPSPPHTHTHYLPVSDSHSFLPEMHIILKPGQRVSTTASQCSTVLPRHTSPAGRVDTICAAADVRMRPKSRYYLLSVCVWGAAE